MKTLLTVMLTLFAFTSNARLIEMNPDKTECSLQKDKNNEIIFKVKLENKLIHSHYMPKEEFANWAMLNCKNVIYKAKRNSSHLLLDTGYFGYNRHIFYTPGVTDKAIYQLDPHYTFCSFRTDKNGSSSKYLELWHGKKILNEVLFTSESSANLAMRDCRERILEGKKDSTCLLLNTKISSSSPNSLYVPSTNKLCE